MTLLNNAIVVGVIAGGLWYWNKMKATTTAGNPVNPEDPTLPPSSQPDPNTPLTQVPPTVYDTVNDPYIAGRTTAQNPGSPLTYG